MFLTCYKIQNLFFFFYSKTLIFLLLKNNHYSLKISKIQDFWWLGPLDPPSLIYRRPVVYRHVTMGIINTCYLSLTVCNFWSHSLLWILLHYTWEIALNEQVYNRGVCIDIVLSTTNLLTKFLQSFDSPLIKFQLEGLGYGDRFSFLGGKSVFSHR